MQYNDMSGMGLCDKMVAKTGLNLSNRDSLLMNEWGS